MSPGASLIWIILKVHSVMIKYSGLEGGKGGVVSVQSWGSVSDELQLLCKRRTKPNRQGGEEELTGPE